MIDFGYSCYFDFNLLNHKGLRSCKLAPKGLRVLKPIITFNAMPLEVWLTLVAHVILTFGCSCNFDFNLLNHKALRSSKLALKGLRVLEPIITFIAMPLKVWLTLVAHVILTLTCKALPSS